MAKNHNQIQKVFDDVLEKTVLRFIPNSVLPNQITLLRVILTPVVYYLLMSRHVLFGTILFILTAFTDAIDGAMARTRNQITDLGKVIDPLADKFLILAVLFYIGFRHPIIQVLSVFVILEMIAVTSGYLLKPILGRPVGANVFGKLKLVTQAVSVSILLVGVLINSTALIDVALMMLATALVFAGLAAVEVVRKKFLQFNNLG